MNELRATLPVDRESTFTRYLEVQQRLVRAPSASTERDVPLSPDLMALREHIDVFVLDGFGVLNIGTEAVPGAVESLTALTESGAVILVLTNGATLTAEDTVAKYDTLGFSIDPENVISSRDALIEYLNVAAQHRHWSFMAPPESAVHELSPESTLLGGDFADYEQANGFILLSTAKWTTTHQHFLLKAIDENPRPVLVANPDLVAPRVKDLSLEPGYYAHQIADATGITPHYFGKPFANAFDLVKRRVNTIGKFDSSRIAMVGDSLHTDILGGAAAGFKTVLVRDHGLMRGMDLPQAFHKAGIYPDYVVATT